MLEVKTYDEQGPGRKQCPKCSSYVGARSKICRCEHEFVDGGLKRFKSRQFRDGPNVFEVGGKGRKECPSCHKFAAGVAKECPNCNHVFEKKDTIRTFSKPGGRRKQCPECERYLSKLARECACGHEFDVQQIEQATKNKWDRLTQIDVEAVVSARHYEWSGGTTLIPAGKCPVRLSGTEEEEVIAWCARLIEIGHEKGTHYAPSALRYFVREFFDFGTEEHDLVVEHINAQLNVPTIVQSMDFSEEVPQAEDEDDDEVEIIYEHCE